MLNWIKYYLIILNSISYSSIMCAIHSEWRLSNICNGIRIVYIIIIEKAVKFALISPVKKKSTTSTILQSLNEFYQRQCAYVINNRFEIHWISIKITSDTCTLTPNQFMTPSHIQKNDRLICVKKLRWVKSPWPYLYLKVF